MNYDLNQLSDPKRFQQLVNAILTARFGEDGRLTPIQGADGGSDGETAPDNPFMEFRPTASPMRSNNPLTQPPRPGRYLFQAKFHPMGEHRLSELRSIVGREFRKTLTDELLSRSDRSDVNYFFLVTNVRSSKDSIQNIDDICSELTREHKHLHADVWWGERITAFLDWAPQLWNAYREIFPGGVAPLLGMVSANDPEGLFRTLKLAIAQQHNRDSQVTFRQIDLDKRLLDLFVDLDIGGIFDTDESSQVPYTRLFTAPTRDPILDDSDSFLPHGLHGSVLHLLLDDNRAIPRLLLEGGPGQGKSTITQMAAQVYREKFLAEPESVSRDPAWHRACKTRIPFRLELRNFGHWLSSNTEGTLEEYVASILTRESGGAPVGPQDIHRLLQDSFTIFLLDGLDEIGNDRLRDQVLDTALEAIERFETALKADVRVVLTTRPPAVQGRWSKLKGFVRVVLAPMDSDRIDDYLERWLDAQSQKREDTDWIKASFNSRRHDSHVEALARNPMQLSVLLQFISLKGEAFPDRRAELYRDYFQTVIDRDVEKSPELRKNREIVEALHSHLGFLLHGIAEEEGGRRALNRNEIVNLAGQWLQSEGHSRELAGTYFALGEERFGLIVARAGEGNETTYGFEVQPIQEYFAAAYVSNHLPNGQAHDVFATLICRDYWREVALFLAGLRRPNEKADLVARAKASDSNSAIDGQQNGRAIILQLLREGIFSQTPHVQTDAMNYAFGFLDASVLRLQRYPQEIVDSLTELAEVYGNEEVEARIVEAADDVARSSDEGLVFLMHRMAGKALPKAKYTRLLFEFSGTSEEIRGLVRVGQPLHVPGQMQEIVGEQWYWQGIPAYVVAGHLWSSARRRGVVADFQYPPGTHLSLMHQFAVGPFDLARRREKIIAFEGTCVPAFWKFYQNIQLIRCWPVDEADKSSYCDQFMGDSGTTDLLWTDGEEESLPQDVERWIRKFIEKSDGLISALRSGQRSEIESSFSSLVDTVNRCLKEPGIVAWAAARCMGELLGSSAVVRAGIGPGGFSDEILEALAEIYGYPDMPDARRRYLLDRMGLRMPLALRLESGSDLQQLHEVATDYLLGRLNAETRKRVGWLETIMLPALMLRPLVEACRDSMEAALRFIGSRPIPVGPVFFGYQGLRVRDTQRILKICRKTHDKQVLRGAAAVLFNARFSRIAEPVLLHKILAAAPDSRLVARIFNTRDAVRGGEEEPDLREVAVKVAHRILDEPDLQPFRVVNRAVVFLAEVEPRRSFPLFTEYPKLQRSNVA